MTSTSLRIITWNANRLALRNRELEVFFNYNNIDITLILEIHFTHKNYLRIHGFTLYHTAYLSGKVHAGSAVIIKNNIKHIDRGEISKEYMQATIITIQHNNVGLNIAVVYCPPRHNIKKNLYIAELNSFGPRVIVGGDFNAEHIAWGSRLITPKGRELLQAINECACDVISSRKPTYWPAELNKTPDLIDFFYHERYIS